MATFPQRAQAIGDAYVNGVATQGQINSLGEALAWEAGVLVQYNSMTPGQKAEFLVTRTVDKAINLVKVYRQNVRSAAAITQANTETDTEFPPTP